MFEYIDPKTPYKICYEIEAYGSALIDDKWARIAVEECGKQGNVLALKALRAIFRSKAATPPRKKK